MMDGSLRGSEGFTVKKDYGKPGESNGGEKRDKRLAGRDAKLRMHRMPKFGKHRTFSRKRLHLRARFIITRKNRATYCPAPARFWFP
jgi:hypothetical protein